MAQKKKVPAKSPAKSKPISRSAVAAKPARKTSETKTTQTKKPVQSKTKLTAKPVSKSKSPVKASQSVKSTAKSVSKIVAKPVASKQSVVAKQVAAGKQNSRTDKPGLGRVASTKLPAAVATKPVASAAPPAAAKPVAEAAGTAAKAVKPAAPSSVAAKPAMVSNGTASLTRTVPTSVAKPAIRTFPTTASVAVPGQSGTPRDIAQKAVDARQQQMASTISGASTATSSGPKKPVTSRHGFKINESIVYPAHGVGRIVGIEEQEIAGMSLELFVIQFEKDKMTLRVPTGKLQSVGMRKLAEDNLVTKSMETLKGRARVKRTMWSRRAQEYEAKINSGDLISIAEVVRDLYRSESQPEQSYSERQLYEAALDRMAREIAAVARIDERGAVQRITEVLSKSAKGRRAAEDADATEAAAGDAKAA